MRLTFRSTPLGALAFSGLSLLACQRQPPPGGDTDSPSVRQRAGSPTLPPELAPKAPASAAEPSARPPHSGPWLAVTSLAAAVYSQTSFDRDKKLGYAKAGAKLAVLAKPEVTPTCTAGWYSVVSGGYVCGNLGTTDLNHPQVRFAPKQPKLDDVLPYTYARNAKNGTPLYKSVPSKDQMLQYEPYLDSAKKSEETAKSEAKPRLDTVSRATEQRALDRVSVDAGIAGPLGGPGPTPDGGAGDLLDPDADKPWWQRENAKDKLHEVTLEQLNEDADDVLAKRMVSGFYIAVDRSFAWNGRSWYKSTKGLVAPADRFWQTAGSTFKGVELDGTKLKLPMAWVPGFREKTGLYTIDDATRTVKNAGTAERFQALPLTGKTLELRGTTYAETSDGNWVKASYVRTTRPGAPPPDLGPDEKWIDVNLKEQTLVAFRGTQPVYATLISSGKESKIKEKDHRTPIGEWRIREKHITTTMDGDGTAAGDLPYSIEDVPYVMYYDKSYALHGAFWHRNYGTQMSHGCVNLSPLDAKQLFFFADPPLPEGWHGVWSSQQGPGTRIVIHE